MKSTADHPDTTSRCDFCADVGSGLQHKSPGRRPMWLSPTFALTPTIGPLSTGHLLLLPRRHSKSFGQLSGAEWSEVLTAETEVESMLTRRFGGTIAFEHGTSGVPMAGGCWTPPRHLHLLPPPSAPHRPPPAAQGSW